MPLLLATIRGDLRAAMEAEIRDVARAMRRGVERAGREVQAELRAQARGADFSDKGRALANSWRLKLYLPPGAAPRSFRPAALVYSNAPKLVEAFDKGLPITAKGGRYLAFPTGYNATRGRRGASSRGGLRVTPAEMKAARGEAFIIRSKSNPAVRLWCLRVRGASGLGKRRRLRLFVGSNVEVLNVAAAQATIATMPITNLQDPQPRRRVRLMGSAATITADLGAEVPIDCVALISTTLGAGAMVQAQLSNVANFSVTLADTGQVNAEAQNESQGNIVLVLPVPVVARHLRIDLTDGAAPYMDIGLLVAGQLWRLRRGTARLMAFAKAA